MLQILSKTNHAISCFNKLIQNDRKSYMYNHNNGTNHIYEIDVKSKRKKIDFTLVEYTSNRERWFNLNFHCNGAVVCKCHEVYTKNIHHNRMVNQACPDILTQHDVRSATRALLWDETRFTK